MALIVQDEPASTMLGLWSVTQDGPYSPIPAVLLFTGRDSAPLMSTRPVYSPQRREVRPRRPPSRSPVHGLPPEAERRLLSASRGGDGSFAESQVDRFPERARAPRVV
jgi:hypothetical protein